MFKDLGVILGNIFLLYKNFIHWTISRLIIFITGVILGFLFSIPFFILSIVFANIDSISWANIASSILYTQGVSMELFSSITNNLFMFLLQIFLWLMLVFSFMFGIQYSTVCIYNLNLNYINGNKLDFGNNYYFNFGKIFKYLKIISLISLFLLIPIILFLVAGFFTVNIIESYNLSVYIVGGLLILLILTIIYMIYRLAFSLIIFLERAFEKNSAFSIIKKSFNVTKGLVFFKVALIYIIFSLILISIFFVIGVLLSIGFYFSGVPVELASVYSGNIINIISFIFVYGVPQMLFVGVYSRYFRQDVIGDSLDDNHIDYGDDEIDDEENI